MYRGTTPTIPITIKGVDLSRTHLFLTFESPTHRQITLESPRDFAVEYDGSNTVGEVTLTQKQTLDLSATPHKAQIRWIGSDGVAGATVEKTVCVKDILLKGVIKYE